MIRFSPTALQGYSGTIAVSGDQTAGTNTIAVSGTGATPPNRPPVVGAIDVFPEGMGLQSVTNFRYFGRFFSDPDGHPLTFSWLFGDGASSSSLEPSHVYDQTGTFETRLTVTDPLGLSASVAVSVPVGTLNGVWDMSCARTSYAINSCVGFPSQFVVTLSQNGAVLTGTLSGGGKTKNFTYPGSVSDPRSALFGVETYDNTFCGPVWDNDMYFRMTANNNLTSMTSTQGHQYCSSYAATKR